MRVDVPRHLLQGRQPRPNPRPMHYENSAHCLPGAHRIHPRMSPVSSCSTDAVSLTIFRATNRATTEITTTLKVPPARHIRRRQSVCGRFPRGSPSRRPDPAGHLRDHRAPSRPSPPPRSRCGQPPHRLSSPPTSPAMRSLRQRTQTWWLGSEP